MEKEKQNKPDEQQERHEISMKHFSYKPNCNAATDTIRT